MRAAFVLIAALCSAAAPIAAGAHRVRGVVTDESGGVLPGVAVVAAAADGRVLATTVTDGAGRYVLGPLPDVRVQVEFSLDGFSPASVQTTIGDTDAVANQRLALATRSERVDVFARLPIPPPPPPPRRPAPVRPPPVMWAVPDHDPSAVCGPAKLESAPLSLGIVRARRYAANGLYGAGDELTIDGGSASGLEIGEDFVVRRTFRSTWDPRDEVGEHTAGLVQIVAAGADTAVAVVVYACDEMRPGDRLAPFEPEPRLPPSPEGRPDFRHSLRILFPDAAEILGAPRRLLVVDRGGASGVRRGQRVTLFRPREGRDPLIVGEAVVVAVRNESATIRVLAARDGVFEGDRAALQR